MNWTNVKSLAIPVGGVSRDVKRVSIGGSVVWEKPSPLPYDAEVEYLECAGTSSEFPYIDTGIIGSSDITFDAQVYRNTAAVNECAIGSYGGTDLRFWLSYFNSNKYYLGLGRRYNNPTAAPTAEWMYQELKLESGNYNLYSNGTVVATVQSSTFNTEKNIYIGCMNNNGSPFYYFRGRFSRVRLYSNDALVRDFIPVRVGSVGYLYDRVSGALFGNAGTGAFGYGADMIQATWEDGSYWDSLGVAQTLSGASRCDNFIPVEPSSTVTFYIGARPSGTTLRMIQYGIDHTRVNATYANNDAARAVQIPNNCYYIRVSAETAKKDAAYIHDDTNGRYLLLNGRVAI